MNDDKQLAKAVRELAKAHTESIGKLSDAIKSLAYEIRNLGNAGATMPGGVTMGAMEFLAVQIKDGADSIASAIGNISDK